MNVAFEICHERRGSTCTSRTLSSLYNTRSLHKRAFQNGGGDISTSSEALSLVNRKGDVD